MPGAVLDLDWAGAAVQLRRRGWFRLRSALDETRRSELLAAAPGPWSRQDADVLGVQQGGMICGTVLHEATPSVRDLAAAVTNGLTSAAPAVTSSSCAARGGRRSRPGARSTKRWPRSPEAG